jgi:hypothetical protein
MRYALVALLALALGMTALPATEAPGIVGTGPAGARDGNGNGNVGSNNGNGNQTNDNGNFGTGNGRGNGGGRTPRR